MMDLSNKYSIYVGSNRGVLQCCYCKPDEKVGYYVPEEQSEITALAWGCSDAEILIGYKNEQVQIFNPLTNKFTKTISKIEGEGPIVGVAAVDNSVLIAKGDGIISIWDRKSSDFFSINLEEKSTLDAIYYNKENVIATGGEYNDLKLWDLESKKCLFKAKSLGHDELNLAIPASIRGIIGFPESDKLVACATKEGHVLLYDQRAQRKAVVKFLEKKASYTCIASAFRERQCLVGTTKGYLQLLDLKVPGKCLKTFSSFTGSVTAIVCDPLEPFVASTSLDRYLRIHNLETKELAYKIYLKQNLTKILMKPLVKDEPKEDKKVDEEYDEIFNNMETITETKKKRKRTTSKSGATKKK